MEQNQKSQRLNIQGEYETKHEKKLDEQRQLQRKKTIKRIPKIALVVLIVGGGISALGWYIAKQPPTPVGDIISQSGIHWHPELTINIKGQKQVIPANVGIGMQYAGYPRFDAMMSMTDMHTHDSSGTLHWEVMKGPVTKNDVRISSFFRVWGKTFSKDCIFEHCNGSDGTVKMLVNNKENTEFENYLVHDKDKIEIGYE